MKVPWRSNLVIYRATDTHFEAHGMLDCILAREVAPNIAVRHMAELGAAKEAWRDKLMRCPFMVLGDDIAVSAVDVVVGWSACDAATVPVDLAVEGDGVILNWTSPFCTYERAGAAYKLQGSDHLFCSTMLLPTRLPLNTDAFIGPLQRLREKTVERQIESSRIILSENGTHNLIRGSDFTLMGAL